MTRIIKMSRVLHVISFIIFNVRSDVISDSSQSLVAGAAPFDSNSLSMCLTHRDFFIIMYRAVKKMPQCQCAGVLYV